MVKDKKCIYFIIIILDTKCIEKAWHDLDKELTEGAETVQN